MFKLKDAQRLRKLFYMCPEDLLVYLSSEAQNMDKREFKKNYGFSMKEAIDSLYELKREINK